MLLNVTIHIHHSTHCMITGEADDENFCAVHLINEGLVVNGRSAALFFKGTKAVDSYLCRLRGNTVTTYTTFDTCKSVLAKEMLNYQIQCTFYTAMGYNIPPCYPVHPFS